NNQEKYYEFLSVCSHEFFHTWNVKRLRPKGITPYNFTKENYIEELWISEGTTSYYQDLMLLKAGIGNEDTFLKNLENNVQNDIRRPGNRVQSLAESSFDAWVKLWVNTPNKFDAESNYYDKGSNVSLLLDLEIRNNTGNKYSLDNVMRAMYERYPLEKGGFTNADFIKVSGEFAGEDLSKFFESYLYGTDTLDWNKYLLYAGLQLNKTINQIKPAIGINTRNQGDRLIINYVVPGLPAYETGLETGDEIIALNGYKVNSSSLTDRISDMNDGDTVTLTVMRNEILRQFEIPIKNITTYTYKITKVEDSNPLQKSIYENWLSTSWK
ncbi:MAG TPA: PDZ domain-containing protein, partial [Ignavibacteria bacterium]